MMHLGEPIALLLLLLLPLVWMRRDGSPYLRLQRVERHRVLFASPTSLSALASIGRARERAPVLNTLRTATLVLLVFALARPQVESTLVATEESGRDIVIALDISGSMKALDFQFEGQRIDRLSALKHVVTEFVENRKGDRMALVVFGSEVYTQCPLTSDTHVLKDFIAGLEIGMVGDGTALGDGLAVAVKRLRQIHANSRVIVLVTDGLKTAGTLEPAAAADLAKREGIKVYTIGIGGSKPAPFPTTGMFGEPRVEYLPIQLDEKTLQDIAARTGGKYYRAQEMETLSAVYEEISQLEQRVDIAQNTTEYDDRFLPFLLLGFALFLLHEVLARLRYELFPERAA